MNDKDLFNLELSDARPADLCFTSELDGMPYDVEAWSTGDKLILVLPKYGKFDVLVRTMKPGLSVGKLGDVVKDETCKCVKEAGRLLAETGIAGRI